MTLQFSTVTPCPAAVIPAMDCMHEKLTTAANSLTVMPALCAVLGIGKKLLNKYYSLMDHSDVYQISVGTSLLSFMRSSETQALDDLVLYPCYKLKYFKKQEWDSGWVKTAKNMVKEEFYCSYANYVIKKPSAPQCKALSKKVFCSESFCPFFSILTLVEAESEP